MRQEVIPCKLSSDSMRFINLQKLNYVLINQASLSKCEILDVVADLRDENERFG